MKLKKCSVCGKEITDSIIISKDDYGYNNIINNTYHICSEECVDLFNGNKEFFNCDSLNIIQDN